MYVCRDYLDKYISVVTWLPKQKFLARLVSKPKVLIRPYWRMLSNNFFQRGHVIQQTKDHMIGRRKQRDLASICHVVCQPTSI